MFRYASGFCRIFGYRKWLGCVYGRFVFGLSYVLGNVFVQIALMFVGGVYLAYLAYVLLANVDYEGAITQINQRPQNKDFRALLGLYFKALGINLSNPKALLFFATIIVPSFGNTSFVRCEQDAQYV